MRSPRGMLTVANQLFVLWIRRYGRHCSAVAPDTLPPTQWGFIRELPHELVAASSRPWQEARSAHLLLQRCDAADERRDELHL